MLFLFAGSTHTNYTNYLLETLCNLELECSRELREATLRGLLINLSGRPGGFSAGDVIQEYFNRLLEAVDSTDFQKGRIYTSRCQSRCHCAVHDRSRE